MRRVCTRPCQRKRREHAAPAAVRTAHIRHRKRGQTVRIHGLLPHARGRGWHVLPRRAPV